jgi:two-component system, OmpR family, KDP operon response regulator KdpE
MNARVLVVEDDLTMRQVLTVALKGRGYEVDEARTGAEARGLLGKGGVDAMLLDLGLPDMDGVDIAREAREIHHVPTIVVSARVEEQHLVRALDAGANDYVTKPFREGELMARLRAALRPVQTSTTPRRVAAGDLELDVVDRRVLVGGKEVSLTPTEFKLLLALARDAGRVVRHERLLHDVWGPTFVESVQYLRVYMKQLRHKVEDDPARPRRLLTALGVGYRLIALRNGEPEDGG